MHKQVNGVRVELTAEGVVELETEWALNDAKQAKTEYARKRLAEYPSVGDQLGAILKGGTELAELKATVIAIKEKYPKPTKD